MAGWGGVVGTVGQKAVGGTNGNLIRAAGNAFDMYGALSAASSDAARTRSHTTMLAQTAADAAANANDQIAIDNALRSRILTQTGNLGDTLAAAQRAMGGFGGSYYSESMLDSAIESRVSAYQDLADRAVDRVSSMTWAGAINRGIDAPGTGLAAGASLGDGIRQQMQNEANQIYQDSYSRAVSDALVEVQGRQSLTYGGLDQMAKMRAAALSEIASTIAPQIAAETALFGKGLGAGGQLDYAALAGRSQAAQISAGLSRTNSQGLGDMITQFSARRPGEAESDADAVANLLRGNTGAAKPQTYSPGYAAYYDK